MVDDAHGSGMLGGGRGIAYHFGVHDRIDIQLGMLSKLDEALDAFVTVGKHLELIPASA
jgi:glycine C-acetyltransferase